MTRRSMDEINNDAAWYSGLEEALTELLAKYQPVTPDDGEAQSIIGGLEDARDDCRHMVTELGFERGTLRRERQMYDQEMAAE